MSQQVLLELSDLFASLVDIREMSDHVALNEHATQRLRMLCRQWAESMTQVSDMNR